MIVELDKVSAGYGGKDALDGLSLRVPAGAVYALLGRNGAGKTTAIRCLLGQLRPHRGEARLFGRDAWRERTRLLARVGVVPETPDAPPGMTVRRLIAFARALYPKWDAGVLAARLDKARIERSTRFGALSRGQKAHVLLALALAASPEVVILDDPTLGLDPVARRAFFGELIDDLADRGTTVFLSTHDLDGVERIATHVGIIDRGRMLVEGPLDEVKAGQSLEDRFHTLVGGAA